MAPRRRLSHLKSQSCGRPSFRTIFLISIIFVTAGVVSRDHPYDLGLESARFQMPTSNASETIILDHIADAQPAIPEPAMAQPAIPEPAIPEPAVPEHAVPKPAVPESDPSCLPYILYDKPVKTGSTAVRKAILKYFDTIGEEEIVCDPVDDCAETSGEVCSRQRPPGHLVRHIRVNTSRTTCLHEMGYYHVTSIREPKSRIISAFKYNRAERATHDGIPYTVSFEEYMARFPRCALYHYYDSQGSGCGDEERMNARANDIVSRMDEVIDLDEEPITDLHRRIHKFVRKENVASIRTTTEFHVPDEVSMPEYVLYNKLREKRISLARNPRRTLCKMQRR